MKDFINNPFTLIHPGERPTMQSWVNFAMTALMAVGTGLVLSGIIFFFAYNWADLHHLTKLGIIATAIAACRMESISVPKWISKALRQAK